jgi:hypothetical protein
MKALAANFYTVWELGFRADCFGWCLGIENTNVYILTMRMDH